MKRRSGYILVQALVAIIGLIALMMMLANDEKSFSDVEQARLNLRRADEAAQAGIARAMASIAQATPTDVTLDDNWAQQGSSGNEEFQFADQSADYRMEIVDAGSLINLNTASPTQLEELPLTSSQVDSLLDWIEPGETSRSDGAKDSFYNSLTPPYNAKLAPLTTLDEILLVQGWTPATIYQPPTTATTLTMPTDQNGNILPLANILTAQSSAPNVSSSGGALINLDSRSATLMQQMISVGVSPQSAIAIAARAPIASFSSLAGIPGLTRQDLIDLLNNATCSAGTLVSGKLNLNTVSQTVLQTVPGLSSSTTQAITQQQAQGFTQLGDLGNLSGISTPELAEIADNFTVGSDTWIVHSYGESGGVGEAIEAVVQSNSSQLSLLSEERLSTAQPPAWWGWSTQTPTTEDAESAQ